MRSMYFDAIDSEIGWYSENLNRHDPDYAPTYIACNCCGDETFGFRYLDDTKTECMGCLACLRKGRFLVYHNTEIGQMIPGHGFQQYNFNPFDASTFDRSGIEEIDLPKGLSCENFDELLRTPPFRHVQHQVWLLHCDDFMTALGRWMREDFQFHAGDGDANALFESMIAFEWQREGRMLDDFNESVWFWAFRCRHCQQLRGYSEYE